MFLEEVGMEGKLEFSTSFPIYLQNIKMARNNEKNKDETGE